MPITPELLQLAYERFLADHPNVVSLLNAITERHARAAGMTLEAFQRTELERAVAREARLRHLSPDALLRTYLAGPQAAPPKRPD
jgi:hypothetical protein